MEVYQFLHRNEKNKNGMKCNPEKPLPEVCIQGRSQDILKEGGKDNSVSN